MTCVIWNTLGPEQPRLGDYRDIWSPRAGGDYRIGGTAEAMLQGKGVSERMRLTTWLCDQRRLGIDRPEITPDLINTLSSIPRLSVTERVGRGLLKIVSVVPRVDRKFDFGDSNAHEANEFLAETECEDRDEAFGLLQIMKKMGLLFSDDGTPLRFELTPQGWARYEELSAQGASSSQGFVAMWFGDEVTSAYADGIKPAIEDAGYRALRIDDKEHIDKIDDQIIAEIRRSRFVVADFSCPPGNVRGGVYYEAGFAHGLRIPVFYTCRQSSFHDVHFDTRQYAHIFWNNHAELRDKLRNRISAVLGDGPLKT